MDRTRLPIAFLLAAALGLAACDTAEERAAAHYAQAKALLAEGRVEQAIVEFRNVFRLDGGNTAARLDYANLMVEQGRIEEAVGQFLRLVEQDWGNVAGHRRLTELALQIQDFETAKTHASRAYELDPADPGIRALKATVDYHEGDREPAVEMARDVLAETPDNLPARIILIADRMQASDPAGALALVEAGLARAPEDAQLHLAKLAILEQTGERAPVGRQLARMSALFPDDDAITLALIRWHLEAGGISEAEPMLRARAEARSAGTPERTAADLALVQALLETRGPDAARAELARLIDTSEDPIPYRRSLAGLDLSTGDTAAGIAALRAIIEETEPSDERRDTQSALARVLLESGDATGSAALVDAVLAEDQGHVEALKLRARRMIDADRPETAILDLRTAIHQEPRDSEVLTLMAIAHEREGARELAGERLAMAVEVSDRGPAESIRYASFLIEEGRVDPAEAVIAEALRRRPSEPELLSILGELRVSRQDWKGAGEAVSSLRAIDTPDAATRATALEALVLGGQNCHSETIQMLQELSGADGNGQMALAEIVQAYIRAGNLAGARTYLEGVRATSPAEPLPRLLLAGLDALGGETSTAEAGYRALIADRPGYAPAYEGLYRLLAGVGQDEAAAEVLQAGLDATGQDSRLLFIRAGQLETEGDFEEAIAVYEALYARDSGSELVANNLASLLSSHRTDAASLDRAFSIARRLRGSALPHYQDTYGWILVQRGEAVEALPALEQAAAALPDDPLVLYHLGVAQARLGQPEAARVSLERALAAERPATSAAAMAEVRALLEKLRASASDPARNPVTEADSGTGATLPP